MQFFAALLLVASVLPLISGTALDDYVFKPDENYKWIDLGPDYVMRGDLGGRGWTGTSIEFLNSAVVEC